MSSRSNPGAFGDFRNIIIKLIFPLICIIFMVYFYYSSRLLPWESTIFPRIIMVLLLIVLIWEISGTILQWRKAMKSAEKGAEEPPLWQKGYFRGLVVFLGTLAYVIIMQYLGFGVSTLLYLASMAFFLGIRNNIKIKYFFLFVVIVFIAIYCIFIFWLKVPLPRGVFF